MKSDNKFRLLIQESAINKNSDVKDIKKRNGETCEFKSKKQAEEFASQLSKSGESQVKVQRKAPLDQKRVDGYLVYSPKQRKYDPDGSLEDGYTFDITANQYGDIGEALITADGTPAIRKFVEEDMGPFPSDSIQSDLNVDVKSEPDKFNWDSLKSATNSIDGAWKPDCEVEVKIGYPPTVIRRYFCEIKTGNGNLQRNQEKNMQAVSKHMGVLKIKVNIDQLPSQYTVDFIRVGEYPIDIDWSDYSGSEYNNDYQVIRERSDQRNLSEFM